MTNTKKDLSYLAGFMDGEGHFGAAKSKPIKPTHNIKYSIRVSVCNTNKAIIDWVYETFGGTYQYRILSKRSPKHKDYYVIHWTTEDAKNLLKVLIPYLRLKKQQATLVLELITLNGRSGNKAKPREIIDRRNSIVAELSLLNKRGN